MTTKIYLATYLGSLLNPLDFTIELFSGFNEGTHSEIIFEHNHQQYAFSTFEKTKYCISCKQFYHDPDYWHLIQLPISNPNLALRFLEDSCHSLTSYRINVFECAMPKTILDLFDSDLDCSDSSNWKYMFCSQFSLLFIRRCLLSNILLIPKEKHWLLWSVNSKGCLPSRLQIIMNEILQ